MLEAQLGSRALRPGSRRATPLSKSAAPRKKTRRLRRALLAPNRLERQARSLAVHAVPRRQAHGVSNRPAFEKYAIASPIASRASKARAKWNADAADVFAARTRRRETRGRLATRRVSLAFAFAFAFAFYALLGATHRLGGAREVAAAQYARVASGNAPPRGTPRARPPRAFALQAPRARAELANRQRAFCVVGTRVVASSSSSPLLAERRVTYASSACVSPRARRSRGTSLCARPLFSRAHGAPRRRPGAPGAGRARSACSAGARGRAPRRGARASRQRPERRRARPRGQTARSRVQALGVLESPCVATAAARIRLSVRAASRAPLAAPRHVAVSRQAQLGDVQPLAAHARAPAQSQAAGCVGFFAARSAVVQVVRVGARAG